MRIENFRMEINQTLSKKPQRQCQAKENYKYFNYRGRDLANMMELIRDMEDGMIMFSINLNKFF